ncbi:MAG: electron transfer flavoprotein subunit beta/FixA family protein [Spirochaetes bacterium]|nr:electron transfer flavoprotein subunit beta/FixA family protein [Spirochaetota bacterium]
MRIIVCIKQVPDPEGPPSSFIVNADTNRVEPKGIPPVLSIFDENALEAALRIKEAAGGQCTITVLSLGKKISDAVMQKALAVGADELFKVEDESLDPADCDSFRTADAIAAAIKSIGEYDLILVGRQAADWNAGQTGIGVACILGLPVITMARKIIINDNGVRVERLIPGGYEVVQSPMPAVVMVSNEIGQLRYPTMIQRREAKSKPITHWNAEKIGFNGEAANRVVIRKLYEPEVKKRRCSVIEGESLEEAGKKLAERLKADKII